MTKVPSLLGWHHADTRLRMFAGAVLLLVSHESVLVAQSLPVPAPGAPEIKPPAPINSQWKNQLLIGAGAVAAPGVARVTMKVEWAPYGKQLILVGVSAEEQVGSTAMMLLGMPASHRFGKNRFWISPGAAFNDEPSWVASGGLSREFGMKGNDVVGTASLNRIRDSWQWSLNFSFVNEKW